VPRCALLALLVLLSARPARAESALLASARGVAHDLGSVPRSALVVAAPLASDVAAPRGDALAVRIASLVASAVGSDAVASERPATLAIARARASAAKAGALVFLDVRVDTGELRVTADVYPVTTNAWDRLRTPPLPPSAHAYVHAPVAAEVRSYLSPLHLERARVTKFAQDAGVVLAMACGDVDGRGGNDLVLVTEREVLWGYLSERRFVVARRAPASAIGHRAPVPLREPFATAVIAGGEGTVAVAWGDRLGARMGPDLAPREVLAGFPVASEHGLACALSDAAHGGFTDARVRCSDGRSLMEPPSTSAARATLDAWASVDLGVGAPVLAARDVSGPLRLSREGLPDVLIVNDVGAQVVVGDLDQDGVPEVVTTLARGEDALVVSSWTKEGLAPRQRWAAPAGVDAVAVCPAEVDDAPSVVAAVGGEIWVVR